MAIVKPYYLERVLRQFEYIQTIPRPLLVPSRVERGTPTMNYQVAYNLLDRYCDRWDLYLLPVKRRDQLCRTSGGCQAYYMGWYLGISYMII